MNILEAKLLRQVATPTFSAGNVVGVDIPRSYDLNSIMVEITASLTVATANATGVRSYAPAQLVNNFQLIADGSRALDQVPGILAAVGNFQRNWMREVTPPSAATIAGSPYAIRALYQLDRATIDSMLRPKDSALHTQAPFMSLLQLQITFGNLADIFNIGSATISGTPTVTVYVDETREFDPADANEARMVRRRSYQQATFTASQSAYQFNLPVGNYIRAVLFYCTDTVGGVTNEPINTVLTNVILKSGADVRLNLPFLALRSKNAADQRLFGSATIAGLPTGFGVADLCMDAGRGFDGSKLWDLRGASEAKAEIVITSPTAATVWIAIDEYVFQPGLETAKA